MRSWARNGAIIRETSTSRGVNSRMNSNARRKKRTVNLGMKTVAVVVGIESSGGRHPHREEREEGVPGSTALGHLTNHTAETTRDKGRVAL